LPKRAGKMHRRSIDRDQQIAEHQYCRGVGQVGQLAAQVFNLRMARQHVVITGAQLALQADERGAR
jgi:hypothetical protein